MFEALTQKIEALQFSRRQQQAFLEDVSALIEDGVPANQAVQAVSEVTTGIEKKVAEIILQKIAEGKPIADGMQNWFPQPIIEIVRAGEEGGTLAENMGAAARALAQQTKGFGSLIAANIYPFTVIIMGLAVAVFIKHSVFVNFADIKPVSQWPMQGQILYNVATFVENWWWLIIILIIALIVIWFYLMRDLTGETRQFLDTLPIFSLYRDGTAARFMEILGLLLTNGIILKRALVIMRHKAVAYLAWHIYLMEIRLSGGRENIAEVLDTGLIRKADILRLRLIAKGKGFEHALVRLGRLSADRTAKNIDVTGKIIGIVLLSIGAAWAAFMILAIYGVGSFVAT
jgi:type II secretory pathway component PulF